MNVYVKKSLGSTQQQKHFPWQKFLIGGCAIVLTIGICYFFSSEIKNIFYYATAPVSNVVWRAGDGVSNFTDSILAFNGLQQENVNLNQENQQLHAQISALQDTIRSSQALTQIDQNTSEDNFSLLPVSTIGLAAGTDIILINKGSDSGITENMPVVSSTKVLYGKVFKVYKNFSQVMLVSNKNSVVDAKVQNQDLTLPPVLGAIKGQGNLSLYLDLVATDAQLNQGDVLMTSGLEGIFPKDLLIGKITSVDKNDAKPFQTAAVQSYFDLKNIDSVFVITDYKR